MHQEVRRYPENESPQIQTLDYRSLNRAILFFESGAFSHGSMQWGPFSDFGAELGLIEGDRRLRLLQLFKKNELQPLTLIREGLQDTNFATRPKLNIADLLGTWQGSATTQYADLRPETTSTTQLVIERTGSSQIRQTITLGAGIPATSSVGRLESDRILFQSGAQHVQVLLLPDGASATCPTAITPRQPIFLEAGWLTDSHTRQRLIRSYDATGAWTSLTLVTERKRS